MNKILIAAAIAGIFATSAAMPASAQDQLPASQKTKCYGLPKLKDECRSGSSDESKCGGDAKYIKDHGAWIMAYPATCTKQGGSLLPPEEK